MNFTEIIEAIQKQFFTVSIQKVENNKQSFIILPTENLLEVCSFLYSHEKMYFDFLSCITGVDNGTEAGTMEVIYHLYSIPYNHSLMIKVVLKRNLNEEPLPRVSSVTSIWRGANWLEREVYDMFGILFDDHPDLRRILLPADWEGYPLRKDYVHQERYHGIKVKY